MQYAGLALLAALEILTVTPDATHDGRPLAAYARDWAEQIIACRSAPDGYFCHLMEHGKPKTEIDTFAYHQLEAMARAALYFREERYAQAAQDTIRQFVEPNLRDRFRMTFPSGSPNRNCFGISSLFLGVTALREAAIAGIFTCLDKPLTYELLALGYASWLYRENTAGAVMWYPAEGFCFDNTAEDDSGDVDAGSACGAESAIEGGFMQLGLNELSGIDHWLTLF